MDRAVRFIRRNGKIIPIRSGQAGSIASHPAVRAGYRIGKTAGQVSKVAEAGAVGYGAHQIATQKKPKVKVNAGLDLAGLGLSVASGSLAAATFAGGTKAFIGGAVAGHALDAAGIAANVASVKGKGKLKERTKQAARQEARNFAIGNAVFLAGLVGVKKNRELLAQGVSKVASQAKRILDFSRKVLRVA